MEKQQLKEGIRLAKYYGFDLIKLQLIKTYILKIRSPLNDPPSKGLNYNSYMSSPNKKQGKFDNFIEPISLIRYATIKNKDQLEDYYSRNKGKLPPILQCRNIFIQHLNKLKPGKTDRMKELTKERSYYPTERTYQSSKQPSEFAKNRSTELIPHLGKLIFDKDNPRKIKRQYLVSYSSVERQRIKSRKLSKDNDLARLERQKSSLIIRQKLKTEHIPRQEEISLMKLLKRIESRRQMLIQSTGRTIPRKVTSMDNRTNLMHINRVFTCADEQKQSRMMQGENELLKGRKVSRQDMESVSYTRPVIQNSKNKKKMKVGKKISLRMNEDLQPWGQDHEVFLYSLAYLK